MGALTKYQEDRIHLHIVKGMSLEEIAVMYDVPYRQVYMSFMLQEERNLRVPLFFNTKNEPYYHNEDDYGKIPTYKWEDITNEEKSILNKPMPDA